MGPWPLQRGNNPENTDSRQERRSTPLAALSAVTASSGSSVTARYANKGQHSTENSYAEAWPLQPEDRPIILSSAVEPASFKLQIYILEARIQRQADFLSQPALRTVSP